jgi:hypothetical protein
MTKRPSTIALAIALLLFAAACGGSRSTHPGGGANAPASPAQLKSIQQLQSAFNTASREPTLVVLISPT